MPYTNVNMVHGFICKVENYKTFRKKNGENLWDPGLGKEILTSTPKAWSMKGKIDNVCPTKLKYFVLKNLWCGQKKS